MNNILKLSLMAFAAVSFVACGNTNSQKEAGASDSTGTTAVTNAADTGKIVFEENAYDFGTVKEGAIVEHTYSFVNEGKAPIILSQVSASCGCTTPSFTQTPVLPGKKGEIKVSFDSNGQVGKQQKIVTVVSNATPGVTTVQLKGEVLAK